jgi:hypothetical protein
MADMQAVGKADKTEGSEAVRIEQQRSTAINR